MGGLGGFGIDPFTVVGFLALAFVFGVARAGSARQSLRRTVADDDRSVTVRAAPRWMVLVGVLPFLWVFGPVVLLGVAVRSLPALVVGLSLLLLLGAVGVGAFRSSVRVSAEGLVVVNGFRTHRLRWSEVADITFTRRPGDPVGILPFPTEQNRRLRAAVQLVGIVVRTEGPPLEMRATDGRRQDRGRRPWEWNPGRGRREATESAAALAEARTATIIAAWHRFAPPAPGLVPAPEEPVVGMLQDGSWRRPDGSVGSLPRQPWRTGPAVGTGAWRVLVAGVVLLLVPAALHGCTVVGQRVFGDDTSAETAEADRARRAEVERRAAARPQAICEAIDRPLRDLRPGAAVGAASPSALPLVDDAVDGVCGWNLGGATLTALVTDWPSATAAERRYDLSVSVPGEVFVVDPLPVPQDGVAGAVVRTAIPGATSTERRVVLQSGARTVDLDLLVQEGDPDPGVSDEALADLALVALDAVPR